MNFAMRLDSALVARGLVETRTKAHRRIRAGEVLLDGALATKPSAVVAQDANLELRGGPDFVGRGALKIVAALEGWGIDPGGLLVLDIGASTGGFTQVVLARGAAKVVAIDVGRNQLHPDVASDTRVDSREGMNIRTLSADWWNNEVGQPPALITVDVSFISLTQVIPVVVEAVGLCDWVALIKPQFEVGKGGVRQGLVTDHLLRERAVLGVIDTASRSGLQVRGLMASPITGEAGNHEYLCWLSPTLGSNPPQWREQIRQLVHP